MFWNTLEENRISLKDGRFQVTELCVSLDDHIFYSGKTKTFLGLYSNSNKEALKVSKVAWKAKQKYRTYLLAPLI
ncbi:UNVERIFIED_CONTAM: hypothetical protein RMT77_016013 [Armadillidium vulgare]